MQAAMVAAFKEYLSKWFKFLLNYLPRPKVLQAESLEPLYLKADITLYPEVME